MLNHDINWKKVKKNEKTLSKTHPDIAVDGISLCKSKNKANARSIKSFWNQKQVVSHTSEFNNNTFSSKVL